LTSHRVRQFEHRLAVDEVYIDRGYVFANESGGYLHTNTLYRRFHDLITRADVPVIRFHDLRHTRATVAKSALIDLVTDTLPPGTAVSLRAFGVVPDSCDSRLVVPRQPLDPSAMAETLQDLEVVNLVKTPLGASLAAVADDLGSAPGPKIVVLVTDGEETCGGDPPAVIADLVASGIDVRVNIVGFALDDDALREQFEEWARLGNGQYIDAIDAAELDAAVARAVQPLFNVIDSQGNIVASGQVGGPALSLPAGIYRVEVLTQPTLIYEVVRVTAGQEMQLVIG
jgi:hypothetical protein